MEEWIDVLVGFPMGMANGIVGEGGGSILHYFALKCPALHPPCLFVGRARVIVTDHCASPAYSTPNAGRNIYHSQ